MTLPNINPDETRVPAPAEWDTMSPEKMGVYCHRELLRHRRTEAGPPGDDQSGKDRYQVELPPPPLALDGCAREEAVRAAEGYARMMDYFFGEI